ncbi:hypothetical protein TVCOMph1_CDS0025 [Terrisporobacter phage TVCOM_ph1]
MSISFVLYSPLTICTFFSNLYSPIILEYNFLPLHDL